MRFAKMPSLALALGTLAALGLADLGMAGSAAAQDKKVIIGVQCDRTGPTQIVGTVLCPARTRGDVPECRGSAVALEDLDLSRLDLERTEREDGRTYAWSVDEVTVAGTWFGGLLRVQDLL